MDDKSSYLWAGLLVRVGWTPRNGGKSCWPAR